MDDNSRLKPIKGMMPDPTKLPQHCTFADRCDLCTEICRQNDPPATWLTDEHMVKCFHHDAIESLKAE
jgi:peptide/nickel transport system ATP-binding protein